MKKIGVLQPLDKVGIVAPSAQFKPDVLKKSLKFLKEKMGLQPVLGPDINAKDFIYSGTPEKRIDSFLELAYREDIKAIWCIRGGYGSWVVASAISKAPAPKTRKLLLGLSDITSLHLAVQRYWKWPGIHGPLFSRLAGMKVGTPEEKALRSTLFDKTYRLKIHNLKRLGTMDTVSGTVTGGNLTLLVSSLKTPWEFNASGKILFIEDIGERAYRLDRMLYQLKVAGKLDHVKALVIGDFTECVEPDGRELWKEVLKRHFKEAPFPVVWGVRSGHGPLCLPLPLGVSATVSTRGTGSFEMNGSYGV